jgi:hypothetical protein
MLISSFHTVPSHQPRRGPIGGDGFDQPASGIFGGKGNALGLAGFDRQRIQPERLPAVIEPVEQPEMMAVRWNTVAIAARLVRASTTVRPALTRKAGGAVA